MNLRFCLIDGTWSRSVEQFDLHKRVYAGKTSRIYTATDRQSGTPVALKIYYKAKLITALSAFQAKREARLHLQLSHPNIIQLYGAFEDENNHYLVQVAHGLLVGWCMAWVPVLPQQR